MTIRHYLEGLKPVRQFRRIERKDLASRIGVTLTSYDRYESGIRRIQFDKVCALADALDCTLDDLRYYRSHDELLHILKPIPLREAAPSQLAAANSDDGIVVSRAPAPAAPPPPPQNAVRADLPPPPPTTAVPGPPPPPPPPESDDEQLRKLISEWEA